MEPSTYSEVQRRNMEDDEEYDESPFLLEDISENDISDIIIDLYELIGEYLQGNILLLSSPTFYKDMFESISHVIYDEWLDADLLDEGDENEYLEELFEFTEQVFDVYSDFSGIEPRSITYENLRNVRSINISDITRKLHTLKAMPQPAQRTPEWYEFRNNLLSASSLSKVFGSESQINSLIYEKCAPSEARFSRGSLDSALHWGVKYEPVTVMIYEDLFGTSVGEFGCIRHPLHPFIGASPDGINMDIDSIRYGRMLEIKNIYNRDITGIPKEEYWVQTQIQMEVCDLDHCDFMETRIKEYADETAFREDDAHEYKGIILHFIETDTTSSTVNVPHYVYMPLHIEADSIQQWIRSTREIAKSTGRVLLATLYWYLDEYSSVLIPRNRAWFDAALPKIEAVWRTIVRERVEGYEHRAPKKRALKNTPDQIENLNITHSICLVKLD